MERARTLTDKYMMEMERRLASMSLDTLYTPQESTTNFSFDFQSKILGLQVILCNLTQSIATERQFYTQQIKCLKKDPYDFHSHMLLNRNNNDKNENKNKCSNSINNDSIDDRASLSGSGDKLQSPARSPSPPSTRSPTKFTSPLRKSPPNPGPRLHCGHSSSEGLELEGDDIPASLARGHHSTRSSAHRIQLEVSPGRTRKDAKSSTPRGSFRDVPITKEEVPPAGQLQETYFSEPINEKCIQRLGQGQDRLSASFLKALKNQTDMENEMVRCRVGAPGLSVLAIKMGPLKTRSTGMTNIWKKRTCILTTQSLYIFRSSTDTESLYVFDLRQTMFKAFDERRFYPTTEASLQFQADTPSEQNEWLLAIQNEVINCRISENPLTKITLNSEEAFIRALLVDQFSLARAIVDVTGESVANLLFQVLDGTNEIFKFIRLLVQNEIEETPTKQTLFRGNSVASKILRWYSMYVGQDYLRNTLLPPCQTIAREAKPMEIFPSKLEDETKANENAENVIEAFKLILDAIVKSEEKLPWKLRVVLYEYRIAAQTKFPDLEFNCVGGFFFLRFINPTILLPTPLLTSEPPSPNVSRGFLYITKILQNMSNAVPFYYKEKEMMVFNDVMLDCHQIFWTFLDAITEKERVTQLHELHNNATGGVTNSRVLGAAVNSLKLEVCDLLDKLEPQLHNASQHLAW